MAELKDRFLLSRNLDKIENKKVLVRVDLNVTIVKGRVLDQGRLAVVKNIIKVLRPAKQIILVSHYGRPTKPTQKYSLKQLVPFLKPGQFRFSQWPKQPLKPEAKYILLENLRFLKEEEENDSGFARSLSRIADVYINEAFSVSHRSHASVIGVAKLLPSFFGLQFEKEIENLNKVFKQKTGLGIVIGGAKIETKLPLIENFLAQADLVVLAGKISQGYLKNQKLSSSFNLLRPTGPVRNPKLLLPIDGSAFDIGPKSVALFIEKLKPMKLIVWNGPLGKIEDKRFETGTKLFAPALAQMKNFRIVGGGDTLDLIYKYKLQKQFNFISTGGGAMLKYLAQGNLVGLQAIQR